MRSPASASLVFRSTQVHMANYGTPLTALIRGEGVRVWDADGREYLDLLAGIAVNALGHAHPAVVEAVSRQAAILGHASNFFATVPSVELAERLLSIFGRDGRVFFCNSGAEANEAAFKISRLTGRTRMISTQDSFHGRTMGALALTGQPAKADPFRPLPGEVTFVPYGDDASMTAAIDDQVAAVIVEPIQGEAGVIVAPDGYLSRIQGACERHGVLFIVDEVQTGLGRTGRWFGYEHDDVTPDVVTLAKGLGGGLPIGATVAFGAAGELLQPGSHGSTFGGNPIACAAALAVLDTIEAEGLIGHAGVIGERFAAGVRGLDSPLVASVRGRGLLRAVTLTAPLAKAVESAARSHGLIINAPTPDALRVAPPLILTEDECDDALARLGAALSDVEGDLVDTEPIDGGRPEAG